MATQRRASRTRSPSGSRCRRAATRSASSPTRSSRPAASSPRSTSPPPGTSGCASTSPARPATPTTPQRLADALARVDGVTIGKVSDRTFLMHLGGKIEIQPKVPIRNRDDLSMVYTPGVARVCLAHRREPGRRPPADHQAQHRRRRHRRLGGARAGQPRRRSPALPVMEGKAALFKRFAGIDAFPICLDTQDVDEIVRTVAAHRAGLRRHQPRGHLGAALLRDRAAAARASSTSRSSTTTSTAPRSWCWPR